MTIDEAIADLKHVAAGGIRTTYRMRVYDAVKSIEQHLSTAPRLMLGRDVPDELLGYWWWIPSLHDECSFDRNNGGTRMTNCRSSFEGRPVDNIEVYGPLPTGGAS